MTTTPPPFEVLDEASCVQCGFCLPACPTWSVLGTEADSPRGRLRLMDGLDQGAIEPTAAVRRHLDTCLLCRACETACPSGVDYGGRLEATRERLRGDRDVPDATSRIESLLVGGMSLHPALITAGTLALGAVARALRPLIDRAPGSSRLAAGLRLLASTPPRPRRLPTHTPARGERRRRVALLAGCVARPLFGDVNAATLRLLSAAGCEVVVPPGQRCCGALHAHAGRRDAARGLARRNLSALAAVGHLDAVVVNAAGCGTGVKNWGALLADDPRWAGPAARASSLARDALELLDELGPPPMGRPVARRVAYHDACHLAHGQGITAAPRRLLGAVPGLELLPLDDADRCCGSAGIYNLQHPEIAAVLRDEKLARLARSGADTLSAANPGCLMHLAAGAGASFDLVHPLLLLDEACR